MDTNDEQIEKLIASQFAALPKKQVFSDRKEMIWSKIALHIQTARQMRDSQTAKAGFAFNFFLLRKSYGKFFAVILVVLLALTVVGGAANAMPGETLYTVKKAAEQVEKVLAASDESKSKVSIKHAKRRLAEVQVLVGQKSEPKIVAKTLEDLKNATQHVMDVSATPELKDNAVQLAQEEKKVLDDVSDQTEGETKEVVQNAISSTEDSISKLVGEETVKGTTVSEEQGADAISSTSTSTPATGTARIKSKKLPKPAQPVIEDAPMGGDIQMGDIVIVEGNEPKPAQ